MGPVLVPIAANWSDWVGVMVTTHFGLVLGLFWVPRGPKRARFGPKRAHMGPKFQIVANLLSDLFLNDTQDDRKMELYETYGIVFSALLSKIDKVK